MADEVGIVSYDEVVQAIVDICQQYSPEIVEHPEQVANLAVEGVWHIIDRQNKKIELLREIRSLGRIIMARVMLMVTDPEIKDVIAKALGDISDIADHIGE